jgi:hypothetical protein
MTQTEIKALVSEGAKLAAEVAKLKTKDERLDAIKAQLRELAGKEDKTFEGQNGEIAEVKQIGDTIARKVPTENLKKVKRAAGKFLFDLFNLAPAKGFELAAYKLLPKQQAEKLTAMLKAASTARVSFA